METDTSYAYIPIKLQTIRIDTTRTFNVYLKNRSGNIVLYNVKGDRFTTEIRDNLINNDIGVLYVHKNDETSYNNYLAENSPYYLQDPSIPTTKKAEIAHLSIKNISKSLFENPQAATITNFKKTISSTIDFVLKEEDALNNLIRLTEYDITTYTHSINVGIYAIGLAKALFVSSKKHNMHEIASGFFLHDIGKCLVPLDIIRKQGPLNSTERELMKNHPEDGYSLLEKFNHLTPEAKVIVLQHHERHDGKGYPNGLKGRQIHIYSKVCTIADVFDALTSKRSYKKSLSSFEALKIMRNEMPEEFDPDFFKYFVFLFSQQEFRKKEVGQYN